MPLLVRRVEDEAERRLEPVGDFPFVGRQRQVRRDHANHGGHRKASDGAVGVEHADWLDRVANTDALTGLANRHTFDRMLQLELARAERQGAPVGLALFGVDGLDVVAERDGAGASDDVLRRVAATLANELRLIDTVARIGPETFAAICPGSPGQEAASRVRDALLNPVTGPDRPDLPITVTAVVAGYPEDGTDADALMEAAARLLDRARASDPGGVAEHDQV